MFCVLSYERVKNNTEIMVLNNSWVLGKDISNRGADDYSLHYGHLVEGCKRMNCVVQQKKDNAKIMNFHVIVY